MPVKVIVSYDGTANEDDAIALGRIFGRAGAEVSLAYVRHAHESDPERERAVEAQAHGLLEGGLELLGDERAQLHVVTDRSTPEGLGRLAQALGADVIVFCSDSHTAKGHVSVGKSAEQLLEGGSVAIAIAPVDLAEYAERGLATVVAVSDADGGAHDTAASLAAALGAQVAPVADEDTGLLVIDSRTEAQPGRVSLNASAAHLIETVTSPVLVLPRGVSLKFDSAGVPRAA